MPDDSTLIDPVRALALDATQAAPPEATPGRVAPAASVRTTVLPLAQGDGPKVELRLEPRARYEPSKVLGVGGMGEVVLVSDHDIGRKVALKRLLPELSDATALARFVDEIRTVGRLEHPNIVPIHDVGIDEAGRYYFVMKYVEGETLESVIQKLAAGDPAYAARYSVEARIEVFLGLLHALEYTHAQGVVHRDIKPANVMIGRFGEVVLMDWGIAKPIDEARDPARLADGTVSEKDDVGPRARLHTTRVGSLIGTPAYMSPEQAHRGAARVDARSDLYGAMVLFHELLGLEHYLARKETLDAMLHAIRSEEVGYAELVGMRQRPPGELIHLLKKGLDKDPEKRFQSARELIAALQAILEGKVRVQCRTTLTKRTYRELGRFVDRSPRAGFALLIAMAVAMSFSFFALVRLLVGVL